jgi:hypothetical protein
MTRFLALPCCDIIILIVKHFSCSIFSSVQILLVPRLGIFCSQGIFLFTLSQGILGVVLLLGNLDAIGVLYILIMYNHVQACS